MTHFGVMSGFDQSKEIPVLVLTIDDVETILTVKAARTLATWLTEGSSRAEADGFLVEFFTKTGAPPEALQAMLITFREICGTFGERAGDPLEEEPQNDARLRDRTSPRRRKPGSGGGSNHH
jgi:hypothetical protein